MALSKVQLSEVSRIRKHVAGLKLPNNAAVAWTRVLATIGLIHSGGATPDKVRAVRGSKAKTTATLFQQTRNEIKEVLEGYGWNTTIPMPTLGGKKGKVMSATSTATAAAADALATLDEFEQEQEESEDNADAGDTDWSTADDADLESEDNADAGDDDSQE